jgi:hypothetical protein
MHPGDQGQAETEGSEHDFIALQQGGVGIDVLATQVDLEISQKVDDHESRQHASGDGHQELFPNGGLENAY